MSNRTKKCLAAIIVLTICSIILNVAPIAIIGYEAFTADALVYEKVAFVGTILIAILLTVWTWFSRVNIKSKYLVLVCGLFFVIENIMPFIIALTVAQLLDEVVFAPLIKYYKEKHHINAEIDKRG